MNGCTTVNSSFEELKKNKHVTKKEYIINQNYQQLYRNGIVASEKCWDSSKKTIFGTDLNHKREIYTDIKEARFTRGGPGAVVNVITLKFIDENTTKMDIYMYRAGEWAVYSTDIEGVKKRFSGECNACKCK